MYVASAHTCGGHIVQLAVAALTRVAVAGWLSLSYTISLAQGHSQGAVRQADELAARLLALGFAHGGPPVCCSCPGTL